MNIKLLKDLFATDTISGFEDQMIKFVSNQLEEMDIDFTEDKAGNIYNINKKDKPLLVAHMDTVMTNTDLVLVDLIKIKNGIIKGEGIIGGDDKCGIYIILELLRDNHEFNFLFTVGEEIGGKGSSYFVENNDISNLPYGLVLDRNGKSDILCYEDDYGSKEFEDMLLSIGKAFKFKRARGVFSDADILSDFISCANLSVGYYNAHTEKEYVNINDLQNSLNFVHHILANVTESFEKPKKEMSFMQQQAFYEDTSCDRCGCIERTYTLNSLFGIKVCRDCLNELTKEIDEIYLNQREEEYFGEMVEYYG